VADCCAEEEEIQCSRREDTKAMIKPKKKITILKDVPRQRLQRVKDTNFESRLIRKITSGADEPGKNCENVARSANVLSSFAGEYRAGLCG